MEFKVRILYARIVPECWKVLENHVLSDRNSWKKRIAYMTSNPEITVSLTVANQCHVLQYVL